MATCSLLRPGGEFATAEPQRCKDLFREHLLANFPFVTTILETLRNKKNGRVAKEFFIDILDEHFSEAEAEEQFQTLLGWGRYAQLFDYDSNDQEVLPVRPVEDEGPIDIWKCVKGSQPPSRSLFMGLSMLWVVR